MTNRSKCAAIIHSSSAAAAAVGAGLAQIPVADSTILVPIQTAMITAIGKIYGLQLTETMCESLSATQLSSMAGKALAKTLVSWIPGIGNAINGAVAASITEGLGWLVVDSFEKQKQCKEDEHED